MRNAFSSRLSRHRSRQKRPTPPRYAKSPSAGPSIPDMRVIDGRTYALCLVSRVTPVQTASRNCTGDGGGPFGFGDQVADPKPPQAAAVKNRGGEQSSTRAYSARVS